MATWLKQSTATTIVIGPLVDSVAATYETGLTISQSEVLVWKEGGAGFAAKNDATAATDRSYGMYTVPLDATDTNTLGQLVVGVYEAGIMVARHDFMVVPAQVYNSLVLGTDLLQIDVEQIDGNAVAAANLLASAGTMVTGLVDTSVNAATTTYFESDSVTEATADHFIGRVVIFKSSTLDKQATLITDYALVGANGAFTVNALTEAPLNNTEFVIV
jgi:uncharacterized membrane protein